MKQFLFILFIFLSFKITSQNNAISGNEKLVYTASYNMSGILNNIAEVSMETNTIKTSSSTLLHLKCRATTYSKWDNFFKIRDLYESFVSPTSLTPYLYKRDIYEGGYEKYMEYKYFHKKGTVSSLKRKKQKVGGYYEEKNTIAIKSKTKDIVATLYWLRTLDFSKAPVGKTKTINVLFDNNEFPVTFTYLGIENISTTIGTKSCHKLAISMTNSNVLKGKTDNVIWLTADENKIPVFVKFKIPVGNGELKIKSASGLKN